MALALKDETITAIHSSPLVRTIETASHIGKFHPSTPFKKDLGLIEMDLGDFEGMEAQQWALHHQDFRKTWERNPAKLSMPGGESLQEVQHRAVDTLNQISELYGPDCTLLICSHNFVIISLLCFASKIPLDQFRELRQDTAALNILYKDGTDFHVEKVNDRRHLQESFQN